MLTSQRPPETETELSVLLVGTREAAYIGDMRCFDAGNPERLIIGLGLISVTLENIQGSRSVL